MDPFLAFLIEHWALVLAFISTLAGIVYFETSTTVHGIPLVSAQDMIQLINHEQAILIDTRDQATYQKGFIPSAIAMDASALTCEALNKLSKKQKKPVILYCQYGQSALKIARRLKKQGFEPIYVLKNGFETWLKANLPVKRHEPIKT